MRDVPIIPMGEEPGGDNAAGTPRLRPWQSARSLSSTGGGLARLADAAERFLAGAGFERAPWLAVVFALAIITWFVLPQPWQWVLAMAGGAGLAVTARLLWPPGSVADETRANLRLALTVCGLVFAFGVGAVWARSAIVGAEPIARPAVVLIEGRVLEREDQPAEGRLRLTLAMRDATSGTARKVRVNVPLEALGIGKKRGRGASGVGRRCHRSPARPADAAGPSDAAGRL